MNRSRVVIGTVLLLAGAGAVGAVTGLGPHWAETGAEPDPWTTATGPAGPSGEGEAATPTEPPPFVLSIDAIDSCGTTCRDVTATLVNTQDREAAGVVVHTTIHAGDSADGDTVWEGESRVGSISAGASVRQTTRIELGFVGAAAVQGAGGEVTIVADVESTRESVRFVRHRDVT